MRTLFVNSSGSTDRGRPHVNHRDDDGELREAVETIFSDPALREFVTSEKRRREASDAVMQSNEAALMVPFDAGDLIRARGDEAKARELSAQRAAEQAQRDSGREYAPRLAEKVKTFEKDDPAAGMVPQDAGDLIRANRSKA